MKKPGHENRLMGQTSAADLIKFAMRGQDSQRTKMLSFADGSGNMQLDDAAFATLQSDFKNADAAAATQEYFTELGIGGDMYKLYQSIENLDKIPNYDEMGVPNNTILRCSDGAFIINPHAGKKMGVATKRSIQVANQLMM